MEDESWELFSNNNTIKTDITTEEIYSLLEKTYKLFNESNQILLQSNTILKESKDLLETTQKIQFDIQNTQSELQKTQTHLMETLNKQKQDESDVIISKDIDYTLNVRESNRAWRLYGNYHKPILPIIYTGLYSGITTSFINKLTDT